MSVSHPLIREFKGHVLDLRTNNKQLVDDYHPRLLSLCVNLEAIFRLGLRNVPSLVGIVKRDYWNWIELLGKCKADSLSDNALRTIEFVKQCVKIDTLQTRGRLFIRAALVNRVLAEITETLVRDCNQLVKAYYWETVSCLADEILAEIFLSLIYELQEVNFQLNLKNCSFLNESWLLPVYKTYEFVPCLKLGVHFGFTHGRVVSLSVEDDSVASEDGKIEVGDVLDEINGECAMHCSRNRLQYLFRLCKTQPLRLSIVKCHALNGSVYLPLMSVLNHLGLQNQVMPRVRELPADKESSSSSSGPLLSQWFRMQPLVSPSDCCSMKRCVQFYGRSFVGQVGTMSVIDEGIQAVVNRKCSPVDVWLEVLEVSVLLTCPKTNQVIYRHNYTQVGSCGRRVDFPRIFCYVAGETICNMAKEFYCYVFGSSTETEAKFLLQNIALGFQRTHFAV